MGFQPLNHSHGSFLNPLPIYQLSPWFINIRNRHSISVVVSAMQKTDTMKLPYSVFIPFTYPNVMFALLATIFHWELTWSEYPPQSPDNSFRVAASQDAGSHSVHNDLFCMVLSDPSSEKYYMLNININEVKERNSKGKCACITWYLLFKHIMQLEASPISICRKPPVHVTLSKKISKNWSHLINAGEDDKCQPCYHTQPLKRKWEEFMKKPG